MKSNWIRFGALALLTIGLGCLNAQVPSGGYGSGAGMASPTINISAPLTSSPQPTRSLSQWIVGTEPDCCGPLSDKTPIKSEIYLRSGASFPFGDGPLEKSLDNGWAIAGGYRALCFDRGSLAAWTFDLGLMNIYNGSSDSATAVPLLNVDTNGGAQRGRLVLPSVSATPSELTRTWLNFSVGREYYLYGAPNGTRDDEDGCWRVGFDIGGRYGSAKVQFRELQHLTDVIGGAFIALHSDYEYSTGCCTWFAGVRTEADYTWSDILQIQNKSDLWGINLLANIGVRY